MRIEQTWHGDEIKRRLQSACVAAVDEASEEGAQRARRDHPSWQSVTGETEASIRAERAEQQGHGVAGGITGGGPGFPWVEIGARGHAGDNTLRRAGDVAAAGLERRIAARAPR